MSRPPSDNDRHGHSHNGHDGHNSENDHNGEKGHNDHKDKNGETGNNGHGDHKNDKGGNGGNGDNSHNDNDGDNSHNGDDSDTRDSDNENTDLLRGAFEWQLDLYRELKLDDPDDEDRMKHLIGGLVGGLGGGAIVGALVGIGVFQALMHKVGAEGILHGFLPEFLMKRLQPKSAEKVMSWLTKSKKFMDWFYKFLQKHAVNPGPPGGSGGGGPVPPGPPGSAPVSPPVGGGAPVPPGPPGSDPPGIGGGGKKKDPEKDPDDDDQDRDQDDPDKDPDDPELPQCEGGPSKCENKDEEKCEAKVAMKKQVTFVRSPSLHPPYLCMTDKWIP